MFHRLTMMCLNLFALIERYLINVLSEFFYASSESWRKKCLHSGVHPLRLDRPALVVAHHHGSVLQHGDFWQKKVVKFVHIRTVFFYTCVYTVSVLYMNICTTYYIKLKLQRRYPVFAYCMSVVMFIPVFCFCTPYVGLYSFLFYQYITSIHAYSSCLFTTTQFGFFR